MSNAFRFPGATCANQQLVLLAALCLQKLMRRVPTAIPAAIIQVLFGFDSGGRGACENTETVHSAVGKCVSGTYAAQMGSPGFSQKPAIRG